MSNPSLDQVTKSLALSGSFWAQRIPSVQKPLIRQLALLSGFSQKAGKAEAVGEWLMGKSNDQPGIVAWSYTPSDVVMQRTWGIATPALPQQPVSDAPALTPDGVSVVPQGHRQATTAVRDLGYLYRRGQVLKAGGEPVFIGFGETITTTLAASLIPVFGGRPPHRSASTTAYSAWLETQDLDETNRLLVISGRDPGSSLTSTACLEFSTVLSQETAWFLRIPKGQPAPSLLFSDQGWLARGSGFLEASGWLALFTNPLTMWPDGILRGWGGVVSPAHPRGSALGQTWLSGSGREIARYRKGDQSIRQFERALCEVAGLPLLDEPGVVARIVETTGGIVHWLTDGRCFCLPGATPYAGGSKVPAGHGHLLSVRSRATHGPDFTRVRPWSVQGFDVSEVHPQFTGLQIRLGLVDALLDEGNVTMDLGQNAEVETAYWAWINQQKSKAGAPLEDFIDFDSDGWALVDLLQLYTRFLESWLVVVETPLEWLSPVAHRALRDFIAQERPSGALVIMPPWPSPTLGT